MDEAWDPRLRHAAVLRAEARRVQARLGTLLRESASLKQEADAARARAAQLRADLRRSAPPKR